MSDPSTVPAFPAAALLPASVQAFLAAHAWVGEEPGAPFLLVEHCLEAAGDWEFALELFGDMMAELATATPVFADAAAAVASGAGLTGDAATTLAKTAHGVKGAAANLALIQLARTALGLEVLGKQCAAGAEGAQEAAAALVPALAARVDALHARLAAVVESGAAEFQ